MSVRTMAAVWEGSQHAGTELLMLLAIADFADDDGYAFPSVPTLARKCRMKPRNARYLLADLEQSGELTIRKGAGMKGSNLYRVQLAKLKKAAPLQRVAPLQPVALPLQHVAAYPCNALHPNHHEPSGSCGGGGGARNRAPLPPVGDAAHARHWQRWIDHLSEKCRGVTEEQQARQREDFDALTAAGDDVAGAVDRAVKAGNRFLPRPGTAPTTKLKKSSRTGRRGAGAVLSSDPDKFTKGVTQDGRIE